MKVRLIKNKEMVGTSNKFNTSSPMCEVVVGWKDDLSDEFASDLEVEIKGEWIPLLDAFKQNLLITDNYNTKFFEPINDEEKERGYRLD